MNQKTIVVLLAAVSILILAFVVKSTKQQNRLLEPTPTIEAPTPHVLPTQGTQGEVMKDTTCQTVADCPDTCDQKTIDMFGNRSHCPIAICDNGRCIFKQVP